MHTIPPHVARLLFDDSGAGRTSRDGRARFDTPPRRRTKRTKNERHGRELARSSPFPVKLADAAAAAGVPVNFVIRPECGHTWRLFESEMQESWSTTIGPALGIR